MTMDRHLQRAHNALRRCAGGLTLEQLTARPPGKWTIAEIIEHLALAFSGTAVGARRVTSAGGTTLQRRSPQAPRPDLLRSLRAFVVVECGYLPAGRDAPKTVIPVGIDPATALSIATDNLRDMDAALEAAEARFGARVKLMDHPIIGPLSTRQWRRFHWVHTRHHVRQIVARTARDDS